MKLEDLEEFKAQVNKSVNEVMTQFEKVQPVQVMSKNIELREALKMTVDLIDKISVILQLLIKMKMQISGLKGTVGTYVDKSLASKNFDLYNDWLIQEISYLKTVINSQSEKERTIKFLMST